jgi:hypothetical protein
LGPLGAASRFESTTAFNAALVKETPAREVTPAPVPVEKDVIAADEVSGAPGTHVSIFNMVRLWY